MHSVFNVSLFSSRPTSQEYQSYTTKETKNRNCTQIEFHPTLRAIFAVTYGERADFDDRVNKRSTVNESEPRFVLLWHLQEPLQPFLKLIAPEEVGVVIFQTKQTPTHPTNLFVKGRKSYSVLRFFKTNCVKSPRSPSTSVSS